MKSVEILMKVIFVDNDKNMSVFRWSSSLKELVFSKSDIYDIAKSYVDLPVIIPRVQDSPIDYNIKEYEKLIDTVSDFKFPWILKNYLLSSFGLVSKKNFSNYLKSYKTLLPFPMTQTPEARFSSSTSVKTPCHNILDSEADMTVQLPSTKLDIKEIYKNVK